MKKIKIERQIDTKLIKAHSQVDNLKKNQLTKYTYIQLTSYKNTFIFFDVNIFNANKADIKLFRLS